MVVSRGTPAPLIEPDLQIDELLDPVDHLDQAWFLEALAGATGEVADNEGSIQDPVSALLATEDADAQVVCVDDAISHIKLPRDPPLVPAIAYDFQQGVAQSIAAKRHRDE